MAAYAITRDVETPFDETVGRVTAALADEGFGVLTTIDVRETMRARLGVEVEPYVILGACNPQLAHAGLLTEPDLGVLLPCNVIVRSTVTGVRVAAMEPLAAMGLADNEALAPLAEEARARLERAVAAV
jgi:uncharacterized protein (DUF302 family)